MTETLTTTKKTPEQVSDQINRIAGKLAKRAGNENLMIESGAGTNFALVSESGTQLGRAGNTLVKLNIDAKKGKPAQGESLVQPGLLGGDVQVRPIEQADIGPNAARVLNNIRNNTEASPQ